ncbi:RsbT co-antagonist protein RsbRD N-terminal domain-containing protein [Candidatus Electrothrix laxa]
MNWRKWLEKWEMKSLKIKAPFLEMTWEPSDADKAAAWELYIELLTRISTQHLAPTHGDEETALKSIYSLFDLTREVIKRHGRDCTEFAKLAVVILNQVVRPFTAEWHKRSLAGEFKDEASCAKFRQDLSEVQRVLRIYTQMLGDMVGLEEEERLTELEEV